MLYLHIMYKLPSEGISLILSLVCNVPHIRWQVTAAFRILASVLSWDSNTYFIHKH